jgi:methyl-accepting chemotaxis protein
LLADLLAALDQPSIFLHTTISFRSFSVMPATLKKPAAKSKTTTAAATRLQLADYAGQLAAISKSQAVIEFNLDGTIITANANFCQAVGYSLEEIQGRHHGYLPTKRTNIAANIASSGPSSTAVNTLRASSVALAKAARKFGSKLRTTRSLDAAGKPFKVVKYASDVTAAKLQNADYARPARGDRQGASGDFEFNLDGTVVDGERQLPRLRSATRWTRSRAGTIGMFCRRRPSPTALEYREFWAKLSTAASTLPAEFLRSRQGRQARSGSKLRTTRSST